MEIIKEAIRIFGIKAVRSVLDGYSDFEKDMERYKEIEDSAKRLGKTIK